MALQKRITLSDGQEIAFWDVGPKDASSAVLLCNGLGARVVGWTPLLDALFSQSKSWPKRRLVVPEYRGQFASMPLVGERLSVERSAADLAEVAEKLGLKQCSLLCWSTGVQVGLQLAIDKPNLVKAMVLIQGTTGEALGCIGQPLCTVPGMPTMMGASLRKVPEVMERTGIRHTLHSALSKHTRAFERIGSLAVWVFGSDFMPSIVIRYGQDMLQSSPHFRNYCGYAEALGRHKLMEKLPNIRAPALVVTGTPDFVTPARCSYDLAALLGTPGGAVLVDDSSGSHYYIFEEPHKLAEKVLEFLDGVCPV